jgi:hypothetical protein
MTYYSGRHGSLRYLGKPVAKVRDWSLSLTVELLETSTVDLYAPTYRPGRKSGTGTATVIYYRPDIGNRTQVTPFTALVQRLVRSGEITAADRITLDLGIGPNAADTLIVNAFITDVSLGATTGELSSVQLSFTMDGDLTRGVG